MPQTMTKPATQAPLQGKQPANKKVMFIARRYEVKQGLLSGNVCNVVRSLKTVKAQLVSNDYQVWTRPDGCTTCDCDSHRPCSHMLFAQEAENERKAEQEAEVARVLAEIEAAEQQPVADLVATVNVELARVQQPAATTEEIAATQAKLLRPDDADQVAYFVQHNRRADEYRKQTQAWEAGRLAQLKTAPTLRNVSQSWLLNGNRGNGTFSGRIA